MDIGASNWNESDTLNNTPAPDGAPEGMFPSGVNDTIRAVMGATKRWYDWSIPKVTGGTSTAYTLSYAVSPGALVDGMTHVVQFNALNGNAPTLNVNSLGATALQYYSAGAWRAVPAALFNTDTISRVAYNASAGAYRLLDVVGDTGEVKPFAGTTAPAGYLLCFGQAISRTNYVGLFTVLGTTYGAGDGSTTFNLPDLRGRVAAGKDDMGGSAASRLTGTAMSPNGTTLGASGGGQTNTATGVTSGAWSGTAGAAAGGDFNALTAVSGSAITVNSFTTVQPTTILNQMIRI